MQYSKCEKTENKTLEGHPSRDSSRVPTPIVQERLLKRAGNHVHVAWELFSVNVITPQVGLNRITREQNVPTIRILLCSFCEEPQTCKPKHEIYTLHFLFDEYIAVPRSPFFAVTVRKISQSLKITPELCTGTDAKSHNLAPSA